MKVSRPISVNLPNYGVLFAESIHASDFEMAERVDPFHKVLYVLTGRIAYRPAGGAEQVVTAGTIFLVPARQTHGLRDLEPSALLLLCLTDRFLSADPDLPAVWANLHEPNRRLLELPRPARERIERMWRRAMLENTHAQTGGGVTVRTLAAQLLVLLVRQQPSGSSDAAQLRVAAVARELRETFYDDWNVDRAAARTGLSRRRFTELFRAETGSSFSAHLTELRLSHAARLLSDGQHSVMGVMFSCGFNDVSHFYRLFRQRYGFPPKRWLEKQANEPLRRR